MWIGRSGCGVLTRVIKFELFDYYDKIYASVGTKSFTVRDVGDKFNIDNVKLGVILKKMYFCGMAERHGKRGTIFLYSLKPGRGKNIRGRKN